MTLLVSHEHIEYQDAIRTFLTERVTAEYLKKRVRETGPAEAASPSDETLWRELGELGIAEVFFSEQAAPSVSLLGLVAAECGRSALPEPLIEHLLVLALIGFAGAQGKVEEFEALKRGELRATLALAAAEPRGTAEMRLVPGLASAGLLLARHDGKLALYRPDPKKVRLEESLDLVLRYGRVPAGALGSPRYLELDPARAEEIELSVRAAQLAGIAAHVTSLTVEYVKTRKQFGVPIGGFQAVQHGIADMYLKSEAAGSLSRFACWACDTSPDQARLASLAAIRYAIIAVPDVVEKAVQLHGGIGFTWEYELHLFLRQARTFAALYRAHGAEAELQELEILNCARSALVG